MSNYKIYSYLYQLRSAIQFYQNLLYADWDNFWVEFSRSTGTKMMAKFVWTLLKAK